ncbi:MAG: hypothetical protein RR140_02850 [Clostridia bacterium]
MFVALARTWNVCVLAGKIASHSPAPLFFYLLSFCFLIFLFFVCSKKNMQLTFNVNSIF